MRHCLCDHNANLLIGYLCIMFLSAINDHANASAVNCHCYCVFKFMPAFY